MRIRSVKKYKFFAIPAPGKGNRNLDCAMGQTYIPAPLRREVYERADGCCEYCWIHEMDVFASHEIDHIIAEKHGGKTESDNLALSCVLCNKHKGSDIASIDSDTGKIVALYR